MWRRGVSLALAVGVGVSTFAMGGPSGSTEAAHAAGAGVDGTAAVHGVVGIHSAEDAELHRLLTQGDWSQPAVRQPRPRQIARQTQPDFDGDGKVDIGVYVESSNQFFALLSNGGTYNQTLGTGENGRIPVPGDYDGDNRTDRALYISSQARYVWVPSSAPNTLVNVPMGVANATGVYPVPGDYDGDGKWDPGLYRRSNGQFFVAKSTGGTQSVLFSTTQNDVPVPGDYDLDNKTDMGVWNPFNGSWFVLLSNGGTRQVTIGQQGNIPAPADYDGDGRTDVAVWNQFNGLWFIVRANNQTQTYILGGMAQMPVPGDYDGDGIVDPGTYNPSNGLFFIQKTSGGFLQQNLGSGRIPLSKRPSDSNYPY